MNHDTDNLERPVPAIKVCQTCNTQLEITSHNYIHKNVCDSQQGATTATEPP